MIVHIGAILVAFVYLTKANLDSTDSKLAPKFYLLEKKNSNGAPSIGITFSDGHKDALLLYKFYSNEEERKVGVERCHYNGHLEKEAEACVAMTGCVGIEDVELTIFSSHTESNIFTWTKDGKVEVIDDSSEVNYFDIPNTITYGNFMSSFSSSLSTTSSRNGLENERGKKDMKRIFLCFTFTSIVFVKNMIKGRGGRSRKEFEDDAVDIPELSEFEEEFRAARTNCAGGGCTLPPTQRLKMRVILISYTHCKIASKNMSF